MTFKQVELNYSKAVNVLIFTFPVVINTLQVAGDIVLFILALMGIFISISQKISPFVIKQTKVFSYLTFGYFLAVCFSVLFSGKAAELAHFIPRDFHFLFAPFIILALFKADININYLLTGIKVALIILGIIVFQGYLQDEPRPSGVMNPAVFGNLAVLMFFVSIVFFEHESFKYKIFNLFSLLPGLYIIVLSGTRGAWLSFLILFGAYLYFFYKKKIKISTRARVYIVIILISLLSLGSFNHKINSGIGLAFSQVSNWSSDDPAISSVSQRIVMYDVAIKNIKDVPFFGYGLRTSNTTLFKDDPTEIGIVAARYNHLHNAFLTNYYNGGIILLGALLLLLFEPLIIFLKANSKDRENPIFISGVILTLGYASFGMVNILFGDTYMNGFYVFFLAIIMVLTNKSIKN